MIKSSLLFALALLLLAPAPVYSSTSPKINEFLAHPSTGNKEWVEFYNPDNVDLSTYFFDDDTDFASDSGSRIKKSLSSLTSPTGLYPFLEFDDFLNNSGDYLVLFNSSGSIIDQYQYTDDPTTDKSIGRAPDGSGNFYELQTASKGNANSSPAPSPSPSPESNNQSSYGTPANITNIVTATPIPSPSVSSKTKTLTPSPKKSPNTVLGEKNKDQPSPSPSPSPAPSPSPSPKSAISKTKVAGILTGGGLVIIGASVAFFLWYNKNLLTKEDKQS